MTVQGFCTRSQVGSVPTRIDDLRDLFLLVRFASANPYGLCVICYGFLSWGLKNWVKKIG